MEKNSSSAIIEAARELRCMVGYPYEEEKDLPFLYRLHEEFPEIDLVKEIRRWQVWLLDNEARIHKKRVNYRSRLRNWCQIAVQKKNQRSGKGKAHQEPQYEFEKDRPDKDKPGFEEVW